MRLRNCILFDWNFPLHFLESLHLLCSRFSAKFCAVQVGFMSAVAGSLIMLAGMVIPNHSALSYDH